MILVQEHILKTMKPYKNLHIHYLLINDLHSPYEYYPYTSVQIILKKRQEILFIPPLQIYGRQFVMSCRLLFLLCDLIGSERFCSTLDGVAGR